ncbi:hypothetical protein GY45DRAFT_196923 [Cubamyces sp. BRFM 1775]|nr:hypothetical protein GY45DRAFT_196923 [Cubamyces sp. BRFM 1775]
MAGPSLMRCVPVPLSTGWLRLPLSRRARPRRRRWLPFAVKSRARAPVLQACLSVGFIPSAVLGYATSRTIPPTALARPLATLTVANFVFGGEYGRTSRTAFYQNAETPVTRCTVDEPSAACACLCSGIMADSPIPVRKPSRTVRRPRRPTNGMDATSEAFCKFVQTTRQSGGSTLPQASSLYTYRS